jgi:hypothetical protein
MIDQNVEPWQMHFSWESLVEGRQPYLMGEGSGQA